MSVKNIIQEVNDLLKPIGETIDNKNSTLSKSLPTPEALFKELFVLDKRGLYYPEPSKIVISEKDLKIIDGKCEGFSDEYNLKIEKIICATSEFNSWRTEENIRIADYNDFMQELMMGFVNRTGFPIKPSRIGFTKPVTNKAFQKFMEEFRSYCCHKSVLFCTVISKYPIRLNIMGTVVDIYKDSRLIPTSSDPEDYFKELKTLVIGEYNKIINAQNLKKQEFNYFLKIQSEAIRLGIKADDISSMENFKNIVEDACRTEYYDQLLGTEVDIDCCDECSFWTVGEHHCSCGNRQMSGWIEGNCIDGYWLYTEAN